MSVFRIECLVRGTKLADVLTALAGSVANLEVRPVKSEEKLMSAATSSPKPKARPRGRTVDATAQHQKIAELIEQCPIEFRTHELGSLTDREGISRTTMYLALRALIDAHKVTQIDRGLYRRAA